MLSLSLCVCVCVSAHHARVEDIVYEADNNSLPHKLHTELLSELSLVRERHSRLNKCLKVQENIHSLCAEQYMQFGEHLVSGIILPPLYIILKYSKP